MDPYEEAKRRFAEEHFAHPEHLLQEAFDAVFATHAGKPEHLVLDELETQLGRRAIPMDRADKGIRDIARRISRRERLRFGEVE